MAETNENEMTEETEPGLEQIEAVSGGSGYISETLKNKRSAPVREAANGIEDTGKAVEGAMKKYPSIFFSTLISIL